MDTDSTNLILTKVLEKNNVVILNSNFYFDREVDDSAFIDNIFQIENTPKKLGIKELEEQTSDVVKYIQSKLSFKLPEASIREIINLEIEYHTNK
jgi:hypothetical protein